MSWTAVVLAGSRPGRDSFASQFGTDFKPLIPVAGEPMVCRPVRALLQVKTVSKILVLSQSPEAIAAVLPKNRRVKVQESQGTIAETIEQLILERTAQFPILVTALLLRRPDLGLELVAWWTLASLIFHAVRLAQARERLGRGEPVVSWLEA